MPGQVRPIADERSGLLAFLAQQRYVMKIAAYGLTDEQARVPFGPSNLSVGGLIKHVATVEDGWIDIVLQQPGDGDETDYENGFRLLPDESLAGVLERYDEVAARTESVIAGIPDLDQDVPVPQGVPWFPDDVDAWSVRWVLLHLITETARHAGHCDVARELVDGATAFPLMAAVEGWPATPWMEPWEPAAGPDAQ